MVSSLSFGQALNHLESKQYIYGNYAKLTNKLS